MIIVDTPFHITVSSLTKKPKYACIGKCKKAWWMEDFKKDTRSCPQCGDEITSAVEGVHFKVIKKEKRDLTALDLKKLEEKPGEDIVDFEKLESLLKNGVQFSHYSKVKNKFIERAKKLWCQE